MADSHWWLTKRHPRAPGRHPFCRPLPPPQAVMGRNPSLPMPLRNCASWFFICFGLGRIIIQTQSILGGLRLGVCAEEDVVADVGSGMPYCASMAYSTLHLHLGKGWRSPNPKPEPKRALLSHLADPNAVRRWLRPMPRVTRQPVGDACPVPRARRRGVPVPAVPVQQRARGCTQKKKTSCPLRNRT